MKLETVVIPVSDVDRAKAFYEGLGWRLDADLGGGDFRIVQLTPPGSGCSVQFGTGLTSAAPGSAQNLLVVSDIEAAHDELVGDGVDGTEVFHDGAGGYDRWTRDTRASGPDPERRTYASFAEFSDPGRQPLAAAGDHEPAARSRRPVDDRVQLRRRSHRRARAGRGRARRAREAHRPGR